MDKNMRLPKISFKSIYTGKQETYTIESEDLEAITDVPCPIDGTRLIQQETLFDPFYHCPNCGTHYDYWSPEYLQKRKKEIIALAKEKLSENSKLIRILEEAGAIN